jgi:peptidoglycan/LPS O-acetylase OafA/YrhL
MISVNSRNHRIDILRGIAILAVLVLHFNISYHLDQSALNKIFSRDFINAMAFNGNYGVTMFFVISGFLITSTSLERYKKLGGVDVVGFYILRFARIMPCLLLALVIIVLLNFAQIPIFENNAHTTSLALAVLSVLTFWHNVLMEKIGYFNYCLNIYWSLSVEEVFYITFPILCLFLKRAHFIIPFWIALIIVGPIFRSLHANDEIIALYGYLACFDAIAIGCCAAIIAQRVQFEGWFGTAIQYGAGLLLVSVYLYSGIMQNVVVGVSLMAIGTAILLIGASRESVTRNYSANRISQIVQWFGKNSYEIYLFHIIVLAIMKEIYSRDALGNYNKLVWMAVFLLTSAFVSGIIAKFYSQPLNKRLREFFFGLRRSYGPYKVGEVEFLNSK